MKASGTRVSNEPIGSLKWTEQVWKAMPFALAQARIDSEDAKNMADKSTKITIFIIWEAL